MALIVNFAEKHIENNKAHFLNKYYGRHSEGAVILFFNKDGSLHQEQFMARDTIRFSSSLPDNAYSEANDYWNKFPKMLVLMSWFYPITYNTPFSIYAIGQAQEAELVSFFNNWVNISSSRDCQELVDKYHKVSKIIQANPRNAEAYWTREEISRVILVAYTRYKHSCLERFIKETLGPREVFGDLKKAASLGWKPAQVQLEEISVTTKIPAQVQPKEINVTTKIPAFWNPLLTWITTIAEILDLLSFL